MALWWLGREDQNLPILTESGRDTEPPRGVAQEGVDDGVLLQAVPERLEPLRRTGVAPAGVHDQLTVHLLLVRLAGRVHFRAHTDPHHPAPRGVVDESGHALLLQDAHVSYSCQPVADDPLQKSPAAGSADEV